MSIVEFLRARLDEDESVARAAWCEHWRFEPNPSLIGGRVLGLASAEIVNDWSASAYRSVSYHIARYDPARVLREVEAKREIVDEIVRRDDYSASGYGMERLPGVTLAVMAAVYADHPDYRDEWQ